jgi:hypothetical protein
MAPEAALLFRELQAIRQPRVWALIAILPTGFTLLLIWQVLLGHPAGPHPMPNANVIGWTIFLWLVWLRLVTIKLATRVQRGKLSISLRGLWTVRRIALADVSKIEVIAYRPVEDYGGYGIRLSKRGRAYIASGDRGVRLTFAKGGSILIGSQIPEKLAQAVEAARSGA